MAQSTPSTLLGFTPAWLTAELQRTNTIGPTSTVKSVDHKILGEGEGFMGIVARLSLSYDGPAGPATMIAKIPTDLDSNRATGRALGIYEREVRIYTDILPGIDIPQPKVYSAIYEADGNEPKESAMTIKADRLPFFLLRRLIKREQGKSDVPPCLLLLEDLVGAGAEVGDQVSGGTRQQWTSALSVLARLHSETWGVRDIPDVHWTKGPEYIPRFIHALYLNGRDQFLTEAAPFFSSHSTGLYKELKTTGVKRVVRCSTEVPQAYVHMDFRLDNMFFNPDGTVAAVIDWQTAAPGPVVVDVAYFVVSSLPAHTPESVVDELLHHYHGELVANGVDDYPLDSFLADYVDGLLIILHRMTGLTDVVDLGDGRGVQLMEKWMQRVDARIERIPA